jgi:hypothetical protein
MARVGCYANKAKRQPTPGVHPGSMVLRHYIKLESVEWEQIHLCQLILANAFQQPRP